MAITHTKVSAIADGADTDLVRPVDWNADHTGQPTSISDFLDDTAGGTDALTTKAPTSNVMYDHGVATTSVHGVGALGFKVSSKVLEGAPWISRDMTAASGNVSYTGAGFQPTALICFVVINATTFASWGMADSGKVGRGIPKYGDTSFGVMDYPIWAMANVEGVGQKANVASYDADGFTLAWTKVGTPAAGTAYLQILCLKQMEG